MPLTLTQENPVGVCDDRWLPCPGAEHRYDVSDLGRVRNRRTGRIMQPWVGGRNYLYVTLQREDGPWKPRLHILVAKAFIPNPDGSEQVNHENGDKHECAAWNLSWMTGQQNMEHAVANGMIWHGSQINTAKLTDEKVSDVLRLHGVGMSVRELSERFGVGENAIKSIVRGQSWKHITRPAVHPTQGRLRLEVCAGGGQC